jgi:hypothetical protein
MFIRAYGHASTDVGCYAVEGISRRALAALKQQTPPFDLPP